MKFQTDIENRIQLDFGENSHEAFGILQAAIQKNDFLKTQRVIRCLLFLSEKSIVKLKATIEAAILDTRDIIFWAEYTIEGANGGVKQIRDFNKTFEDSEIYPQ